jgi:hypothetical protein
MAPGVCAPTGASYSEQLRVLFQRSVKVRRFESLSGQRFLQLFMVAVVTGLFWFQRGTKTTVPVGGGAAAACFPPGPLVRLGPACGSGWCRAVRQRATPLPSVCSLSCSRGASASRAAARAGITGWRAPGPPTPLGRPGPAAPQAAQDTVGLLFFMTLFPSFSALFGALRRPAWHLAGWLVALLAGRAEGGGGGA